MSLGKKIYATEDEYTARLNYPKFNRYFRFKQFLRYVAIKGEDECWEWKGGRDPDGYGRFNWKEKGVRKAPSAAYEFFIGDRKGYSVLHTCDNPPCCNPAHLWLGTQQDNIQDMMNKGRNVAIGPAPILTRKQKKKIRKLYRTGSYRYIDIAVRYNVSPTTIRHVVNHNYCTD